MTEYRRFLLWLIGVAMLAAVGGWQWQRGIVVDSDILALLPESSQDALVQRALGRSAEMGEGLVLMLVGAEDRSAAVAGARWLEQQLELTHELKVVRHDASGLPDALRPYRHRLLSAPDRALLQSDPAAWLAAKRAALYGPAGWQRAADLADDPLYLQGDYLLSLLPQGDFDAGYALRCEQQRCYAAVITRLAGQRFALDDQQQLLQRIASLTAAAADRELELLSGGLPLFIASAASQARHEISTVGLGSILGIVALLLFVFRGLRPLLLSLIALATGTAAAALACLLVFGRVHLVALIFGASLVGVAIDYTLHWLSNRFRGDAIQPMAEPVLQRALGLALLTSMLGFGLLTLAPFPGLRQIALFFAVGLSGAWLTVVLAFPFLGRGMALTWRPSLGWPGRGMDAWSRWGRHRWTWVVGAACILLAGLARLEPNDDLRLLQSVPTAQLTEYSLLQRLAPYARDSQFFLVRGADTAQVLETETELLAALRRMPEAVAGAQALTEHFPTLEAQRDTQRALQSLCDSGRLEEWLLQLGAAATLAETECIRIQAAPALGLDDWTAAVGPPWQGLWLGCEAGGCASMVALSGVRDLAGLRRLADSIEGVEWVDPVARISDMLGHYREVASRWLLLALLLVPVLLMARLGPRRGLRAALVPALTAFSVLATLGWLGVSFSLFHLMALLVVGGISVDYAVFNTVGGRHAATALAVLLAALTTLLAFGLLALSQTPLVAAFGATLALGIGYALLWAPLVASRDE